MNSVEKVIDLLYEIEVYAYIQQLLVEIVFDYTGFSFMLTSYYQFVVFCASFFRVIINTAYISMLPIIWEFWITLPFFCWVYIWYYYIRTLKHIILFKRLKFMFLSSNFVTRTWPSWRLVIYQYLYYFTSYTKIFKNYINLNFPSLSANTGIFSKKARGSLTSSTFDRLHKIKWGGISASIVEFIHTTFVYMPYAFKFGNRKQSYFRNYFNAKKRYNNWLWKWRK